MELHCKGSSFDLTQSSPLLFTSVREELGSMILYNLAKKGKAMSSDLVIHRGARFVERAELDTVQAPLPPSSAGCGEIVR
jgi:hypothetical protein